MRRVYLDNAGSGIASPQQLEACAESMKTLMLSNPHSRHATAQQTHALIENARLRLIVFIYLLGV
jgi:cysteine sulfinate desulfinase/cysteine desulfurase-like protein